MGIPSFLLRSGMLLIILAFQSGCATQQYHDWYEGKPAKGAVLNSAPTILVEAINGRDAGASFIGQQHSYELAPGEYTVVVSYADMYDLTADDFEKVESSPVKMTFTAKAGATYQLRHEPVDGVEAARKFAKKPDLKILDQATGKPVEVAIEYTVPKRLLPTLRFASEEEKVFVSDYNPPAGPKNDAEPELASDDELSALKMLQFTWEQASQQEREAFLRWIDTR